MVYFRELKSFKKNLVCTAAVMAFGFYATPAFAQVDAATRAADPGRAQQDLLDRQELPEITPTFEVKEPILQKMPEGAENIKFNLKTLQIDGVTAYDASALDPLYRDKLGTTVSLAEIYAISTAITTKYRNEGYILTQVYVPPQTIEEGTVKLQVVEGFVDGIMIEGEKRASEEVQVRKLAENLKKKSVLNSKDLERNLLLINDLPGVTARAILSPSKTTVGASDMTLIVTRDYHDAEIGIDNHGSRYLGPYQATVSGQANSYFGYNELLAGQIVNAGDKDRTDELLFASAIYEQPITSAGTKLRMLASYADTEPGYDLKEFDVHGRSQFLSLGVSHPFIRSRELNLAGRVSTDMRNVYSKNNVEPRRNDKIRSVRVGGTLQFIDTIVGIGANALDVEISRGIDLLGASDKGDDNLTRERGDPQYTKANLAAQRLQRLTSKINLLVAGEAQWSADPLLSSEEFGLGGMNIGRAYDSSEIVGDDGVAGKLELQFNKPYEVQYVHDYQLFAFIDTGKVWNQDATASDDKVESLTSAGFGVRADVTEQTKAGAALAFPLTRDIDSRDDQDTRFFFNLSHEF